MARQPNPFNNIEREFTLVGQKLPDDELEIEMPEEGEDITLDGMEMTRNEDGSVEFGEPESPSAGEVGFF